MFSIGKINLLMLKLILFLIPIYSFPIQEDISETLPKPIVEYWNWDAWDLYRKAKTRTVQQNNIESIRLHKSHVTHNQGIINQKVTTQYKLPLEELDFSRAVTLEFLTLNHVNQAIGFELIIDDSKYSTFSFSTWDRKAVIGVGVDFNPNITSIDIERWKKYWSHILLVFESNTVKLFLNGGLKFEGELQENQGQVNAFLNAFLDNEPFMELGDLIKYVSAYNRVLSLEQIEARFGEIKSLIELGKLYPNKFHYNAFPYINHIQSNKVSISWETNEPCITEIKYGKSSNLEHSVRIENNGQLIQNVILDRLHPETTYYYQLKSKNADGDTLSTALLTFQTSKVDQNAFLFGIVSDTESRPQINRRVGELLWDERPDFLIHLGDLTDGGHRNHKFEWNMEYFQGIGPLTSRIPIITVPGNGDADLFWYKKYHPLAGEEGYYHFEYAQGSFWMLNSNQKKELQKGGKQYEWLSKEMIESQSKWKFVVLHHAPYSADEDDYGNSWIGEGDYGDKELKDLISLIEENSVDMVFFGHLHTYMRTYPLKKDNIDLENGVVYVQAGGTGGNLEDNAPTRTWFSAKTFRDYHYCTVQLVEGNLELRMYNLQGSLIDFFNMHKD